MTLRLALAAVLAATVSEAAAGTGLDSLLKAPLSPGSVALLVRHAADPRVAARWVEALKDARPDVRATAARAINVAGLRGRPLAEVMGALRTESDEAAALEQAWAAVALGAPDADVREAVQRHAAIGSSVETALQARDAALRAGPRPARAKSVTASRIPGGFPPGLVRDVLAVAGCRNRGREDFHGGRVEYGPENRPRVVTMLGPHGISTECMDAVEALLFLALRPGPPSSDGAMEFLVFPLSRDAAACVGEVPPAPIKGPSARRVGAGIQEPKKIRNVAPWYPATAQNERVHGVVILEATIASSGCVSEVRVLKGADPRLDLVALLTVAQWAYTPTLLDGVAVPVIMTVTVNFRLS